MDSEPEYKRHEYFNFRPAGCPAATSSCSQQTTENHDSTRGAQSTHPEHMAAAQDTTLHPGTDQNTSQYPGTNQNFSQRPNPLAQQMGTTHRDSTQYPGANHHPPQHPGTTNSPMIVKGSFGKCTLHPGQYQFGRTSQYTGTSQFPGPPLYTPYFVTETGSHFQQTATQLDSGVQRTAENTWNTLGNNSTENSSFNNSRILGNTACPSVQSQNSNIHQFAGQNVKESELEMSQDVSIQVHR